MYKRKMISAILLVLAIGMTGPPVSAQVGEEDSMRIVLEKARADKKLLVLENMQLTSAEAKSFWPIYERYQDELFLIRTRTIKLLEDFAGNYEKMTNSVARKLLEEAMTIESLRLKLNQAYMPKFRNVLPDLKVARYYQIENKVQAAIMYDLARKIPLAKTGG